MNLSRRLFTEFKNSKYLNSYLIAMRLFNCDVLARTLMFADIKQISKIKLAGYYSEIPEFIDEIYFSNKDGIIINNIFSKKSSKNRIDNFDNSSGLILRFENDYKTCRYMLKKNASVFIIIEFNSYYSQVETPCIREILNNASNSENWLKLNLIEEESYLRFMTTFLANTIFETINNTSHITKFEVLLKQRPEIRYIAFHAKNGINEFLNFDPKLATYPEAYYAKSAKTLAYYMKVINYNNKSLYEVTIPIYYDKVWNGAFRIGITKL